MQAGLPHAGSGLKTVQLRRKPQPQGREKPESASSARQDKPDRLETKIHPLRKLRMQSSNPAWDSSSTQRGCRGGVTRQGINEAEGQAHRGNPAARFDGKRRRPRIQGDLETGTSRRRQQKGRDGATRKFP